MSSDSPDPDLLRALLRAARLRRRDLSALPQSDLGWLGFVPDITANITSDWSGYVLLAVYVASQVASTWFMPTQSKGQRVIFLILPFVFAFFILDPPGGTVFPVGLLIYWMTTNLWTVGQGIVTAACDRRPARARQALVADSSKDREGAGAAPVEPDGAGRRRSRRDSRARSSGRRRRRAAVTEGLSVEATGETVGEAKWAALARARATESRARQGAVEFQVVAEGEARLLGVGYTPARVVATVAEDGAVGPAATSRRRTRASSPPSCASWSRTSRPEWASVPGGRERGGRTPSWRPVPGGSRPADRTPRSDDRRGSVPGERDPGGGSRERRRSWTPPATGPGAKLRSARSRGGQPMTPAARRSRRARADDGCRAQDRPRRAEGRLGVETTSEGTEPNRFVVVFPSPWGLARG